METNNIIYHLKLAEYYVTKPLYLFAATSKQPNTRKINELPWQLSKAKEYDELKLLLTNYDFFLCLSDINRYLLWNYWESIPAEIREMVSSYTDAIKLWEIELGRTKKYELVLNELEHFLVVSGEKKESARVTELSYELALRLYHEDDLVLAIRRNNLACSYYNMERYSEAESMLQEALPIYLREFGKSSKEYWIMQTNLGTLYIRLDKLVEAEAILRDACTGTKYYLGASNEITLTVINNLAEIEWYKGNYLKARNLFEEAKTGRINLFGANHPLVNEIKLNINYLNIMFIDKPFNEAAMNLISLLQRKGLIKHAEKMKKSFNLG